MKIPSRAGWRMGPIHRAPVPTQMSLWAVVLSVKASSAPLATLPSLFLKSQLSWLIP